MGACNEREISFYNSNNKHEFHFTIGWEMGLKDEVPEVLLCISNHFHLWFVLYLWKRWWWLLRVPVDVTTLEWWASIRSSLWFSKYYQFKEKYKMLSGNPLTWDFVIKMQPFPLKFKEMTFGKDIILRFP